MKKDLNLHSSSNVTQDSIAAIMNHVGNLLDSAAAAAIEGYLTQSAAVFLEAIEELGRGKMHIENLGETIADAPSSSTITVDEIRMSAKDARIQVGLHYLKERGIKDDNDDGGGVALVIKTKNGFEISSAVGKAQILFAVATIKAKLGFL